MKNKLLCTVLGLVLAASAAAYDYVHHNIVLENRAVEKAAMDEAKAAQNKRYNGLTVADLCEGYDPIEKEGGLVEMPFKVLNQHPELPVGCEITCTASLLDYLGYSIDKCELADNWFTTITDGFTEKDGTVIGPDPYECFVGDPYGKGFGCYDSAVADVLTNYLRAKGSDWYGMVLEDSNSADLESLTDGGVPVIVWASIDMKPYRRSASSEWTTRSGKSITWMANSHTLILIGYDNVSYYFMDCNNKNEIQRYAKNAFIARWDENGRQAVIVKKSLTQQTDEE